MSYHVPERLNADFSRPVVVHADELEWTPSPLPGVERRFLDRVGGEVARATSLVRYAPGSSFSAHVHEKGEEFLVLSGDFSDSSGEFGAGSYVRNPPGSSHAPFTTEGGTIFVKLRQMRDEEAEQRVVVAADMRFETGEVAGLTRCRLFDDPGHEHVSIEQFEAGTQWSQREATGGEEILVLEGELQYGNESCPPMTWLRIPPGGEQSMSSTGGCRIWVKRGHLLV